MVNIFTNTQCKAGCSNSILYITIPSNTTAHDLHHALQSKPLLAQVCITSSAMNQQHVRICELKLDYLNTMHHCMRATIQTGNTTMNDEMWYHFTLVHYQSCTNSFVPISNTASVHIVPTVKRSRENDNDSHSISKKQKVQLVK